ncbi:MAG: DUF4124 domain-containing protein [Burkholderiales bacterium]
MRSGIALLILALAAGAQAQTIYKCKGPDGRVTYSNQACAGDGEALSKSGVPKGAPAGASSAAAGATPAASKQCDNGPLLKPVVARLDGAATPDDVRAFLADERFRLLRCDYVRFTPEERRERDAAMTEIDAKDPARRKAAMARILALYDRHAAAPPAR